MSEHSESLDVEIDEVEVLDPIDTSSDDTMESESVHSDNAVYDENLSDNPDDASVQEGRVSEIDHFDVEVIDDDQIGAIDDTIEVIEASDIETVEASFILRPSSSRPRNELRRKRNAAERKDQNHNERKQSKYRNYAPDLSNSDTESDAEMSAEQLFKRKFSLVEAAKRPLDATCDATAAKNSQPSGVATASNQCLVEAASHSVGEASHDTIQDLLGENARLREQLATSSSASAKYDSLVTVLQAKIECPVCYEVPKQAPVPVCSNGHVVCQTCKRDLCPTCRVRMGVATSILAITVIENIPHPCQFQLHGCQETCSLGTLPSHQTACKYRTVKCPNYYCDKRLPLSELVQHALNSRCIRYGVIYNNPLCNAYSYIVPANQPDQFDNRRNYTWKPVGMCFNGKNFFFKMMRQGWKSMWFFYVQMAGSEVEAKLYTVTIQIFKAITGVDGKNSHRFIGDVCSIEMMSVDTAAEAGYCCVLTDAQMKKLFTEGLAGGDNKYSFSVKVKIEVEELILRAATTETPTGMIELGGNGTGVELSSDQTDMGGMRIMRRGRELSPLNLAQNSSQTLDTSLGLNTTLDEELIQVVASVPSGTSISRTRRHS